MRSLNLLSLAEVQLLSLRSDSLISITCPSFLSVLFPYFPPLPADDFGVKSERVMGK